MAISSRITCDTCHETKAETYSSSEPAPKTCSKCREERSAAARQEHLDALSKLTTEERLRKIEEFIYDHQRSYHHPRPAHLG